MTGAAKLFFFNDTATTEIYTLSLHDALPISEVRGDVDKEVQVAVRIAHGRRDLDCGGARDRRGRDGGRSEEHTSELQSLAYLVCRLLLEKNKEGCRSACTAGLFPGFTELGRGSREHGSLLVARASVGRLRAAQAQEAGGNASGHLRVSPAHPQRGGSRVKA